MIRKFVAGALFLASVVAVARAGIVNGNFEGGVTGGDPNDWVCHGDVSVLTIGTKHMAKLDEPNSGGGVSRLYQVITAPQGLGSGRLSFRYALVSFPTAGPASATTPPDTFTVFLVDPNTGLRRRLVDADPPVTNPLFWGRGFLCEDTEGHREFASSAISVTGPDADWMYTVVFQTDLQPNQQARLEFGLAGAANGRTTYAVLDDVTIGCPPGYCCDESGGIAVIDDGNPCTVDSCDNGVAQHISCCDPNTVCGNVAVMFMIDISPSMSAETKAETRRALLNVLDAYKSQSAHLRIGVGRFGVDPNDHPGDPNYSVAQRVKDPAPDPNYDLVRAKVMDPNFFVGGWGSPLADAITKGRVSLGDPNQNWTYCLVLLTDGFMNFPPRPTLCDPNRCECTQARQAAVSAAQDCASSGIAVCAKLYYSKGGLDSNGHEYCPEGNQGDPGYYEVMGWMHEIVKPFYGETSGVLFPPDPNERPQDMSCELARLMRIIVACHNSKK